MKRLVDLKKDIRKLYSAKRALHSQYFFKTGFGQYGYGDKFLGLTVPEQRALGKKYSHLTLSDIQKLLNSAYHEDRLISLLILVDQFSRGSAMVQTKIYKFYLKNLKQVNNWDLVDLSCYKIVGRYLLDKPRAVLYKLAKSKHLWSRRVAIVSTMIFIKQGELKDTLRISEILLKDQHDLIHKAVGWLLREVGKKDQEALLKFLNKNLRNMPRTVLRYAIERLPEKLRQSYLAK